MGNNNIYDIIKNKDFNKGDIFSSLNYTIYIISKKEDLLFIIKEGNRISEDVGCFFSTSINVMHKSMTYLDIISKMPKTNFRFLKNNINTCDNIKKKYFKSEGKEKRKFINLLIKFDEI